MRNTCVFPRCCMNDKTYLSVFSNLYLPSNILDSSKYFSNAYPFAMSFG